MKNNLVIETFKELRGGIKKNLEYIQYCKIKMEDGRDLIMKRKDKYLFQQLIKKYHLEGKTLETIFANLENINNRLKRNPEEGEELGILESNYNYCYYNIDYENRFFSPEFLQNVKTVTI